MIVKITHKEISDSLLKGDAVCMKNCAICKAMQRIGYFPLVKYESITIIDPDGIGDEYSCSKELDKWQRLLARKLSEPLTKITPIDIALRNGKAVIIRRYPKEAL